MHHITWITFSIHIDIQRYLKHPYNNGLLTSNCCWGTWEPEVLTSCTADWGNRVIPPAWDVTGWLRMVAAWVWAGGAADITVMGWPGCCCTMPMFMPCPLVRFLTSVTGLRPPADTTAWIFSARLREFTYIIYRCLLFV